MTTEDTLPEELSWADGGHASDVVLTALADGEHAIVPLAVRTHVEGCNTCARHLGHAALLSLRTARELAAHHAWRKQRAPLPRRAISAGVAVALLGLVPGFAAGADPHAGHLLRTLARTLSMVARRLGEPGSASGLFFTYATAALLVGTAVAVVRRFPRKEASS